MLFIIIFQHLHNLIFIGVLCCLHGQTNGDSSPELYLLESTDDHFNPVSWLSDNFNHNTQFWNKVSYLINYSFKVLELFDSNLYWKNNDKIQFQNVITMPTKQYFSTFSNRKIEKKIPKRIPREVNKTLNNYNVIQQSTTFSSAPAVSTKEIKNQSNLNHPLTATTYSISTTNISQSVINLKSTLTPLNNSIDTSGISSTINSTTMTSNDIPLISSITVKYDQTFQINITNKNKVKVLSDILPDERKFYHF